jgi:hypothetical protein
MRRSSRPDADTQRFPAKWPSGSPQKTRQRNKPVAEADSMPGGM